MSEQMSATEWARWLQTEGIAKIGSDDHEFLKGLVSRGLCVCYDAMFGNRYYALTEAAKSEGER